MPLREKHLRVITPQIHEHTLPDFFLMREGQDADFYYECDFVVVGAGSGGGFSCPRHAVETNNTTSTV